MARAAPADLRGRVSPNQALFIGTVAPQREGSIEARRISEASPITHVAKDDPPFLLIHGDADETVLYQQSEAMRDALQKVGVEVKLLRIPGGGHGPTFGDIKNPPDYIGEMIAWFDKYLPIN